jgi:hypothetical protein
LCVDAGTLRSEANMIKNALASCTPSHADAASRRCAHANAQKI